jgi:hypothetical protein
VLKGNLATRPFYNERLVSLLLIAAIAAIVALGAYNATELMALSGQRTDLNERIGRAHAETATVKGQTAKLRQSVDQVALRRIGADTQEANTLIDQRTFSWTTFFSIIQGTLPYDVRLTSVTPRVDRGIFRIKMGVIAKTADDLQRFIESLRATGVFPDAYQTQFSLTDENFVSTIVDSTYLTSRPTKPKPGRAGRSGGRP